MRSVMLGAGVLLGACLGGGAAAQDRPRIDIGATGMVEVPPEVATISYMVRGEGQTPDDATRALNSRKQAIETMLAGLRGTKVELHTDNMRVREVRGPECRSPEMTQSRSATGLCAVQSYITELRVVIRVSPPASAGTITGAIAQAGGSEVTLGGFDLIDRAEARRKAVAMALANAKAQAEVIASASGAKLGPILRVVDGDQQRYSLASSDIGAMPSVSGSVSAPVAVKLAPDTVKVYAQLTVSYEIVR
ncbi:SIMPL domain-containing protein [Sphingomonas sp. KR3-1]|uniref:SIMPL domain-containing protein n=1 Tax=Sphingomonas sp. KR3-1 TaxID=3156611 RepID=UPI0032B326D6